VIGKPFDGCAQRRVVGQQLGRDRVDGGAVNEQHQREPTDAERELV
jgi:hypothetical protein